MKITTEAIIKPKVEVIKVEIKRRIAKKINPTKTRIRSGPGRRSLNTKTFENKTYYFCPNHKAWTLHKPEECRMSNKDANKDNYENSKKKQSKEDVTFASALASIEEENQE